MTPNDTTLVFRVTAAVPEIGALPGDYVVLRPFHPTAKLALYRPLDFQQVSLLDDTTRFAASSAEDVAAARLRPPSPPLRLVRDQTG